LYIAVMTHPTTAGVLASFASLGDIILAEPDAMIGFTGPRVIKQTMKQDLPEGFQTAEFMLEHGFVDAIVERHRLRSEVAAIMDHCV
jgi:acetyl-CoA carboxylase carboxyl transferase subunit beta